MSSFTTARVTRSKPSVACCIPWKYLFVAILIGYLSLIYMTLSRAMSESSSFDADYDEGESRGKNTKGRSAFRKSESSGESDWVYF